MIAIKCKHVDRFIDYMLQSLNIKTYKELAKILNFDRAHLSKYISKNTMSYYFIVQCLRALPDLTIQKIEALAGTTCIGPERATRSILGQGSVVNSKACPFDQLFVS